MFGYIARRDFDEVCRELEVEQERRRKAEALLEGAQAQAAQLLNLVNELLDRSMPKPVPGFGIPPGLPGSGLTSSTEILKMPAVGKRGIRERNAAARSADVRDEAAASEADLKQRRASLTAEEQAALDKLIPK